MLVTDVQQQPSILTHNFHLRGDIQAWTAQLVAHQLDSTEIVGKLGRGFKFRQGREYFPDLNLHYKIATLHLNLFAIRLWSKDLK